MKKSILELFFVTTATTYLFSCEPASVSYIDPSKLNTTQSAQENSCSVTRISESEVRLTCPDGTTEVIKNGTDGTNGTNGQDGQNGADGRSIEVIDPCGAESKIGFDEVLIRLPDRTVIAYFRFESYEHLTRLAPGRSYMTTDDTQCTFSIESDGTILDARGGKY
jgi:hypothetical protein